MEIVATYNYFYYLCTCKQSCNSLLINKIQESIKVILYILE